MSTSQVETRDDGSTIIRPSFIDDGFGPGGPRQKRQSIRMSDFLCFADDALYQTLRAAGKSEADSVALIDQYRRLRRNVYRNEYDLERRSTAWLKRLLDDGVI